MARTRPQLAGEHRGRAQPCYSPCNPQGEGCRHCFHVSLCGRTLKPHSRRTHVCGLSSGHQNLPPGVDACPGSLPLRPRQTRGLPASWFFAPLSGGDHNPDERKNAESPAPAHASPSGQRPVVIGGLGPCLQAGHTANIAGASSSRYGVGIPAKIAVDNPAFRNIICFNNRLGVSWQQQLRLSK